MVDGGAADERVIAALLHDSVGQLGPEGRGNRVYGGGMAFHDAGDAADGRDAQTDRRHHGQV